MKTVFWFGAINLSAVTDEVTDVAGSVVSAAVIVIGLGLALGALHFGGPWLLRLFRGIANESGGRSWDPTRNYDDYKGMRADGWKPIELHNRGKGPL